MLQVDAEFSDIEEMEILQAIHTWKRVTQDHVSFMIEWNIPKPGAYKDVYCAADGRLNCSYDKMFIWSLPKTSDQLTKEQLEEAKTYRGLMAHQGVDHVIIFQDFPHDKFYGVVLHELGHLLGMNHVEDDKNVMFFDSSAACIGPIDSVQICNLYDCTPSPEC